MQQLPQDLLEEILSKLQVKDLLRFKSVCKNWKSIISSQQFIQLHFKKSVSTYSRHRIFMPYRDTFDTIDYGKHLNFDYKIPSILTQRPDETIEKLFEGGACDGLLYYLDRFATSLCVWNPALRLSKTVYLKIPGISRKVLFFWFGRESSNDEYKLVLGIFEDLMESSKHAYLIKPFSDDCITESTELETDDPSYFMRSSHEGTLLSGTVHWLSSSPQKSSEGSNYHYAVFTYNLGSKTLGKLLTPVGLDSCRGEIGVIKGCFSAVYNVRRGGCPAYEVWIMKEYGVKDSWTKFMNLSSGISDRISYSQRLKLVAVTDKGDLILSCAPVFEVLVYDVAEKKSRTLVPYGNGIARMYVETLVFPPFFT